MKTHVITKFDDQQHKEWVKGQSGYIDGYCRGGDNVPYAIVIMDDRLVMIPLHSLEVLPI